LSTVPQWDGIVAAFGDAFKRGVNGVNAQGSNSFAFKWTPED
jgi:hypothetical protein